jgi:hypothetical protein
MKNSTGVLLFACVIIFVGLSCSTIRSNVNPEAGWVVVTNQKSNNEPFEFITLRLHNAENTTDTIRLSMFVVNGIDFPTEDSLKKIRVFNGTYKIVARAIGLRMQEITVHKKAHQDVFVDFYMKYEPIY